MFRQTCLAPPRKVTSSPRCGILSCAELRYSGRALRINSRPSRHRLLTASALKGVLCDLDGVMYTSGDARPIPGAVETLLSFRERQVPWLFVTNTNTRTREGLASRLRGMGIPCTADDIVSPAKLAADWLRAHSVGLVALFVAPELLPEFEGIPQLPANAESGAGAVVIGDMGLDWNYSTLNRAFRLVMEGTLRNEAHEHHPPPRPRCGDPDSLAVHGGPSAGDAATAQQESRPVTGPLTLLSLGKVRYYKDKDGYSIDVGPFTAAIEYASDQSAVVLGKPDPLIFCLAAESMGLKPEEVVMIGDDVRGDVGGAQSGGLRGVLVQTGKFREHDLHIGITPDAVLPSIAEFPAWWEAQQQQEQEQKQEQKHEQEEEQLDGVDEPVTAALAGPRWMARRSKAALVRVGA